MSRPGQRGGPRRTDGAEARAQRHAVRRDATRTAILDAARSVLLREGSTGTTLDAIAAELGLTKQGLYYHFASKEALLAALTLAEWTAAADAVHAATSAAPSPADALEAFARTYFARYSTQLPLFRLVMQWGAPQGLTELIDPEVLAALRPLNDRMYGPTEHKLAEAQRRGLADPLLHPRRLSFLAHTSAVGLLGMKLMVESVHDPLKHTDEALLAELCRTLRAAVAPSVPAKAGGVPAARAPRGSRR
jgi:AcrR family transcriptional regulator